MSSKDAQATSTIREIQNEISTHTETADPKVVEIDSKIIALLNEANANLKKGMSSMAIPKLNSAFNYVVDRSTYCSVGGRTKEKKAKKPKTVEVKKTRAEELQSKIDEVQGQINLNQKEFNNLSDLYQRTKDPSLISRGNTLKMTIQKLTKQRDNLQHELSYEMTVGTVIELEEENRRITEGRTHTVEELEVAKAGMESANTKRTEEAAIIAQNQEILQSTGFSSNPFETSQNTPFEQSNPFETAQANPYGQSQGMGSAQSQQFGGFDGSQVGTQEMARDIKRTLQQYDKVIDEITDQIEDADEDLRDYNAQLRPLLERRKSASPSDCLTLDGEIDRIQAKRSAVINKIKVLRQNNAKLSDQKNLIEKLSTQQDMASLRNSIAQLTGGRFSDFAGLAMFLNNQVKEGNEELEDVASAIAVSESEEISMNSASGAYGALGDAYLEKDGDKYAALEAELGMM